MPSWQHLLTQASAAPGAKAVTTPTGSVIQRLFSVRTVRREIGRGHLRAVRIGRVWRVRIAELEAYLGERIMERLMDLGTAMVPFTWTSHRRRG